MQLHSQRMYAKMANVMYIGKKNIATHNKFPGLQQQDGMKWQM